MLKQNGSPKIFYHGTGSQFDTFRPLSHFGGKNIAEFFAGISTDVVKGESLFLMPDNEQTQATAQQEPVIIPAHLKMNNPLLFPSSCLFLSQYQDQFFYTLLQRHLGVSSVAEYIQKQANGETVDVHAFSDSLGKLAQGADFLSEYRFVTDDPKTCPYDIVKQELALENLYPVVPDTEPRAEEYNRAHLMLQRMIRTYESMGYDGILYAPYPRNFKYEHAITFRPECVERLDKQVTVPERQFAPQKESALAKIKADRMRDMTVQPLQDFERFRLALWSWPKHEQAEPANRLYWTEFALTKIMPEIAEITNQSKFGYHGLEHTEQVVLFGIEYALAENIRPLPVILACALHDCAREKDGFDKEHGPNCEPVARQFLAEHRFDLTDTEVEQIVEAIIHHTTGRDATNGIAACLWDADRTRLSWERGFDAKFFSTDAGKRIASFSKEKQQEYLEKQMKYLASFPEWNSVLVDIVRQGRDIRKKIPTTYRRRSEGAGY